MTNKLPTYGELMPRLAEALRAGGEWDDAAALDWQLLRCCCESDLAGILKARTEFEHLHPLAGGRWSEVHLDVLPKARTGLRPLTPRRYAAAACLEALEALSIPVFQGDGQPTFTEAESMEFGRLLLAEQLHGYIQHLTADEARPLLPMDAALQRLKARVAQRTTGVAPDEESPATDGPQAAPESTRKALETKEQRQDRRLKACEAAGLRMDKRALSRLPDGVGDVADSEGVTRQAFSSDVKAALKRRFDAERATVRRA